MKKFKICFLIVMCLFIVGCSNESKEVVTLEQFSTVTSEKDFVVVLQDYSKVDYIEEARKATLNGIEIEMIRYTDSEFAEKVQEEQIDNFNLLKTTGAYEEKDKGSNYYRYALVSNGYFMINTRVDNTLIFCKTLLENKESVEEIFDELGY